MIMKNNIRLAILSTLVSSVALAEPEVSGKITHESASYTSSGTTIGAASSHGKDNFKSETNARIYVDGALEDEVGSTYHVELQGFHDGEAINNYDSNEEYTQRDALREAYIDTTYGDWAIRAGKQQTVWGTADGMKLLDAINPTDYSELAQNQMEDSRIPVWMINAEKTNEDGSNFQFIVSESRSNYIPGFSSIADNSSRDVTVTRGSGLFGARQSALSKTTAAVDRGQPFIMKGVDAISGYSEGILNIVPELGEVATTFAGLGAAFTATYGAGFHLENWNYATVEEFVNNTGGGASFGGACGDYYDRGTTTAISTGAGGYCLQEIAYDTNQDATNLLSGMSKTSGAAGYDSTNPDTTFEYMPDATFKTFATFASAKTKYIRKGPDSDANVGLRYKNTTPSGVNYSLNYLRGADANPHVELEWQNASGQKLTPSESIDSTGGGSGATGYRSIVLTDPDGNTNYGSIGGSLTNGTYTLTNPVTLALKEKNATIDQIGGSFDMSLETEEFGPVVIRGEALYQKGVMTPIVDKAKMSIGNITEAFTFQKGDRFKYVIGADVTALTNMMVSFQFIQDKNLDYVDTTTTLTNGKKSASNTAYDTDVTGARYTADLSTMTLANGYQKAEKDKNFYSFFLSKPFGESGQHRWNNIFIYEENGGKWNRLDAEYTIDDNTVATAEFNKYWGNENTQFGQFKNSSNVQLGLKYSF